MGGGASTLSLDDYVSCLESDKEAELALKCKVWTAYSEDIEWACKKLDVKVASEKEGQVLHVGRRSSSDVQVNNKTTSASHASLMYDTNSGKWKIKDENSTTGTIVFTNGREIKLKKESIETIDCFAACRLGASFITFVPSSLSPDFILECTQGPEMLQGKFWRFPKGANILCCGKDKENSIRIENKDLSSTEYRIFKFNGWFAISCVAERKKEATDEGEDKGHRKDGKKKKDGIFIQGKSLGYMEMVFVWPGMEVKVAVDNGSSNQSGALATFLVKVKRPA